jgi:hypothetical protein
VLAGEVTINEGTGELDRAGGAATPPLGSIETATQRRRHDGVNAAVAQPF